MNSEAPVNAGHKYANNAEDYEENEQWLKAAEAHFKAAEQFEIALKDTQDPEATKTLQLLTSNHKRKANELNRKAQRLIKSATNQRIGSNGLSNNSGLRYALPENKQYNKNAGLLVSRLAGKTELPMDEGSHHRTSEIGESYALLNTDDNEDDPFNKFLEAVEGLVQQLFNPAVAFTSAPLNENDIPIPIIIDAPIEEPRLPVMNTSKSTQMMESFFMVPSPDGSDDPYRHIATKIPSISLESQPSQETDDYKAENKKLRAQIAQLTKRMKKLEASAEEGNLLKSSVLQFRNDVHKQAKRIMQSHHESSMRSSAAAVLAGGSISSSSRYPLLAGGGHDLSARLRELEAENKQLRAQNEKQNVLVTKYKERWEMLKENAKKRRAPMPITEENEV